MTEVVTYFLNMGSAAWSLYLIVAPGSLTGASAREPGCAASAGMISEASATAVQNAAIWSWFPKMGIE